MPVVSITRLRVRSWLYLPVLMIKLGDAVVELNAGEKIAQMIPVPVLTGDVVEVDDLEVSARAGKGFGSTGR